ncbi:serine hydrolase [Rathayibacter sp. VKM Ac-2803]|uniref:serine hydrolase domain-containing protein n=1 Tax=Rathayibacter sp. VKM Ac-2803 TaxID=2609256 RepID=UPI00135847C4|nr:serine hydrolase domain-containing protein [Rathayibacter sp. VKM Ac-2803]MWV49927.1 serine hydrolase [Rathayibacter sp. VKM Ac-2803]
MTAAGTTSGHDGDPGGDAGLLSASVIDALTHWFDRDAPVARSISYAVFDRRGILFEHAIGEADASGALPRRDTVYRIASLSKSFQAAAVLLLRDRGLLTLDDRLSAHVPQFTDPVDRAGVVLPVTVRMVLSNCSGLPEDNGWADHEMGMAREEFLALVARGLAFTERPGDGYQYSNIGFWLLGILVENVSGREFADLVASELLEPLGLTGTRYRVTDYAADGVGGGIAQGFSTVDRGRTWSARPVVGSGVGACAASLFSTLPDIARWSSWLGSAFDPENADDAILSRASRREMQRGSTTIPAGPLQPASPHLASAAYGLGLVVEQDERFGTLVQHSGGLPGWSANMRWHPASGIGVAVFANTDGVRAAVPAAAMLRAVLVDLDLPAREIALLPSTLAAARAVEDAIVRFGDVAAPGAAALFSPNLLSDVPADVRRERLSAALAEVGGLDEARGAAPLTERMLWSASAAQLTFLLPGRTGNLECRIELTPTEPALVQRLVIEERDPASANASVVRHYRPVDGSHPRDEALSGSSPADEARGPFTDDSASGVDLG